MKIKFLFLMLIASITFANAQNEDTSSGWDEGVAAIIEMTPFDLKDIPSIYVGNLPRAWQGHSKVYVYANAEKNLFSLYGTTFAKKEVSIPQNVLDHLKKNRNLKAFLHKNERHLTIVDEKGKIVKKMKR